MNPIGRWLGLVAAGLIAGLPLAAVAQDIRVVLVTKVTLDDKPIDPSSLEVVVIKLLKSRGTRVVELGPALAAQRAAFSDRVQEGKVPKELSTLNADFISSFQLICSTGQATQVEAMGETSVVHNYPCDLNEKIIRIDTGDVSYANSRSWTGTPWMSAQLAMRAALKESVGPGVTEDLAAWKIAVKSEPVSLDLTIVKLKNRDQASALATRLAAKASVTDARVVQFDAEFAKLTISVESPAALKALIDTLEKDPSLPLKITHETERQVHAAYDFDRAHERATSVFWSSPPAKGPGSKEQAMLDTGGDAVRSALQNLRYLDVKGVEKVAYKSNPKTLGFFAPTQHPLRINARFSREAQDWTVTIELAEQKTGTALASSTSRAAEPFVALDQAVRAVDDRYRVALEKPATRKLLAFNDEAPGATAIDGLFVEAFELAPVFPARLPRYRKDGIGTLKLKNRGAKKLTEGKARFTMGTAVLAEIPLADLEAGEVRAVPVAIDTLPARDPGNQYQQLTVTLTWRSGERYGKLDAVAPLLLQRENAIDWSAPQSLAAFIDAQDPRVRQLATAALARRPAEQVLGKGLRDAGLIFSALWHAPLAYVPDPVTIDFGTDLDAVQTPGESLERGAGDCDDLTVLLASLFESVGISTAVITVPGHVLLAVDAGVLAGGSVLYDLPASLFVTVDGALFVPLEATAIGSTFADAWQKGAKSVRDAGARGQVFRTRAAWRNFPTVSRPSTGTTRVAVSGSAALWSATESAVRGNTPGPAWSHALSVSVLEGKALAVVDAPTEPLQLAIFDWLSGRTEKAQEAAARLCNKAVVEACYDLAVMLVLESEDENKLDAAARAHLAQTVQGALVVLPENVAAMLLDHGAALGDEASAESAARRRMEEVLKQARERLKARKAQVGNGAIATVGSVAGRKGKLVGAQVAAGMFFWAGTQSKPR